jgi:zinc and cadmium transporter
MVWVLPPAERIGSLQGRAGPTCCCSSSGDRRPADFPGQCRPATLQARRQQHPPLHPARGEPPDQDRLDAERLLRRAGLYIAAGFTGFLALEQFLQWHHSHRSAARKWKPVAILILLGDALHNSIGGLGIASTFLLSPAAGVAAWCAAVAHEFPQELGDFAILVHSGSSARTALSWNFISALTVPVGAVLAWLIPQLLSVGALVLFASGNVLYIAASDLVPEIKAGTSLRSAAFSFGWFSAGLLLMLALAH